jgi:hypothetical protein
MIDCQIVFIPHETNMTLCQHIIEIKVLKLYDIKLKLKSDRNSLIRLYINM